MELNQRVIDDRKDMFSFFDDILANDRDINDFFERKRYIKTQIIESNIGVSFLKQLSVNGFSFGIKPTKDKFLHNLIVRHRNSNKHAVMYIDSINKRFWKIYNLEKSLEANKLFSLMTNKCLNLDSLWIPHEMLQNIGKRKKAISKGFSIKFSQEVMLSNDEFSPNSDISNYNDSFENFTIRLWTRKSKPSNHLMEILEKENMPTTTTSTRLQIGEPDHYVKDEIFFDGRFTIQKGNDFKEHNILVDDVVEDYSEKMENIEENRIRIQNKLRSFKLQGHPFELKFSNKVPIKQFIDKIFAGTQPFRIWGVEYDVKDDFMRIAAVDCHTGDKFDIDLMEEHARIYLRNNSCGNLIFRLYTNIQHYFDPKVKIRGEHGPLF